MFVDKLKSKGGHGEHVGWMPPGPSLSGPDCAADKHLTSHLASVAVHVFLDGLRRAGIRSGARGRADTRSVGVGQRAAADGARKSGRAIRAAYEADVTGRVRRHRWVCRNAQR